MLLPILMNLGFAGGGIPPVAVPFSGIIGASNIQSRFAKATAFARKPEATASARVVAVAALGLVTEVAASGRVVKVTADATDTN